MAASKKVYGYGPARPAAKPMAKPMVKAAPAKVKPQLSQRDSYAKAMAGATKRGGSNGIGVGK